MAICENCEQEHDGIYGSGRFCSSKCARGFSTKNKRAEINEKVAKHPLLEYICPECKKSKKSRTPIKFCSNSCRTKFYVRINPKDPDLLKEWGRKGGLKSAQLQSETRRSKNEILFAEMCKSHFSDVECNVALFNGWDADVIIHDCKVAVLWNGPWHYKKITKKHSVEQVQNRDRIKIQNIIDIGYIPYIIKDMGKHNPEFVKEKFDEFVAAWTGDRSSWGSYPQ